MSKKLKKRHGCNFGPQLPHTPLRKATFLVFSNDREVMVAIVWSTNKVFTNDCFVGIPFLRLRLW